MITFAIILMILLLIFLFFSTYPAFGGRSSKEKKDTYKQSKNFSKGKFTYPMPTNMEMSLKTTITVFKDIIKGAPNRKPHQLFAVERMNPQWIQDNIEGKKEHKLTWFGHSTFLLELNGKTIFIDPMLGKSPSPFPFLGGKRYSRILPLELEQLPPIDIVLFSHDHYDHLDYGSIKKLKDKVKQFYVPLGLGSHLERWGVHKHKIKELDWWDEVSLEGMKLACTPARYFSGRSVGDRHSTLWCSWVITHQQTNIYYSGDSGYGPHFKEIGIKYGPFDITLMECGQYDERWSAIHLMPEETIQAQLDVMGSLMIPIHWGAFTLAMHAWTDPVERQSSVDIQTLFLFIFLLSVQRV